MKILMISTWPPQLCGIADYTYNLVDELVKDHTLNVAAEWTHESTAAQQVPTHATIHRNWQRRGWLDGILKLVSDVKPDVVHIQHEFGLFTDHRTWTALLNKLQQKTSVVVTLHTVLLPPQRTEFFTDLSNRNIKIIVHTAEGAAVMQQRGCATHTILHGASPINVSKQDIVAARTYLKIPPTRSLGLCPGFLSPGKGHEEIIEAFANASGPDDKLAIVGLCRNTNYQIQLEQTIDYFGLASRIILDPTYQSSAQRAQWFSAADYVVLGAKTYKDLSTAPRSASGQLATAIGYGLPIIAKNVPIYRDIHVSLLYDDVTSCAAYMYAKMVDHEPIFFIRDSRMWSDVAVQHEEVYKS